MNSIIAVTTVLISIVLSPFVITGIGSSINLICTASRRTRKTV